MFRFNLKLFLATLISSVFADIRFTSPAAGSVLPVGPLHVAWIESGEAPTMDKLTSYQLFFCAGGNSEDTILQLFPIVTQGRFTDGNQALGTINPFLGASTPVNS
jgi:hypothetical protein